MFTDADDGGRNCINNNIFGYTHLSTSYKNYVDNSKAVKLISDSAVQAALTADQGEEAKLDTWETLPFTKKGDNLTSFVTSIQVKFRKGNQNDQISYVVKINPCRPNFGSDLPNFVAQLFQKEGKFYLEMLPELNNLLSECGKKILPFPKCYYAQYVQGKEMLIFEDMRLKGFKMIDEKKGMDLEHTELVIQGLGCFHAASKVVLNTNSIDELKSKYPFLFDEFWTGEIIESFVCPSISTGKEMLSKVGGHENAMDWLDMTLPNIEEFFKINCASCPPFNAICHGDCRSNNVLFRYNETGLPVEVMFLDVQLNRFSSLATDLNHFMFTSVESPVRKPNIGHLLTEYYTSFSSVIEGCGQDLPFTKEQLQKEYKKKNAYGLILGTAALPTIVLDMDDVPDMENLTLMEWQENALAHLDRNPVSKPRFVDMYDEMLEEGLFS